MEALRARVRSDAVPDEKRGDAVEAAKALEQAPYFAIRLSRTDAQTFAPLGWKLSLAAQNGIQNAWPKDSTEANKMAEQLVLSGTEAPVAGRC
jgi:hypothetical protein